MKSCYLFLTFNVRNHNKNVPLEEELFSFKEDIFINQMSDPNLYILQSNGSWIKISDIPNYINYIKYVNIYTEIKAILKGFEGKGSDVDGLYKNHVIFSNPNINVKCVFNESHRMCSILACIQYDKTTEGLRYLVYGTKYNLNCEYGIGLCLEGIDLNHVDKWCPRNITAKHI